MEGIDTIADVYLNDMLILKVINTKIILINYILYN
jgi:hypothetical protein